MSEARSKSHLQPASGQPSHPAHHSLTGAETAPTIRMYWPRTKTERFTTAIPTTKTQGNPPSRSPSSSPIEVCHRRVALTQLSLEPELSEPPTGGGLGNETKRERQKKKERDKKRKRERQKKKERETKKKERERDRESRQQIYGRP
jgi:hypothetical protein